MKRRISLVISLALLALAAVLPLLRNVVPAIAGPYPLSLARSIFTYMALALSWDMLFRSGQVSFGIAGFFGLGIYGSALAVLRLGVSPWLSIPLAAAFAALVAFLLGFVILRLRAIYFSITTLALAEIFRIILHNGGVFTGGAEGLFIPNIISADNSVLYWLALSGVMVALGASSWFERSKIRFALTAIRNNELSAKSSGIGIFKYLLLAFVVTSFVQGFAGGILLQSYGSSSPDAAFDADYTLLPLAMALLGGVHSSVGPVIGAILLGLVAEILKLKIPYGHLVVYGLIIIIVILFMPNGLYGLWRKWRRGRTAAGTGTAQRADGATKEAAHG
jgi:branched-chain amino acid transport system permease protein